MFRLAFADRLLRSRRLLAAVLALACAWSPARAGPIPAAPDVDARAFIVVDFLTAKVLAAKEATARMEPASLTKLMTAYIVFEELAAGKLKLDEPVTVSEHAWRSEGSRTFIELGKPVPVEALILGMIVQSGNDATIALAERIAGAEPTFVQLMNANAQRLGMVGTHFENSSGLPSPQHYTTARDMSLLAAALIRDYPQYYKYYSIREFEFNGIKQQNRNGLLNDPSVDGLKTGHTDSAGYCLVTSALRAGMRLISVVLGSTSMRGRESASAALLTYGFTFYETPLVVKGGAALANVHVWKAAIPSAEVGIRADLYLTVPRGSAAGLKTPIDVQPNLIAPLGTDSTVGELHVLAGSQTLATVPVHPLADLPAGGWWRRLIDTIRLWFA